MSSLCGKKDIKKGRVKKPCLQVVPSCNIGILPSYIYPCQVGQRGRRGKSVRGLPGERGPMGQDGAKGAQGMPGMVGPVGSQGGTRGAQGNPGDVGMKGAQGNPGDIGMKGAQGNPGDDGQVGAQGEPGQDAIPGSVGAQGAQGNPGTNGQVGVQGAQGNPGGVGQVGAQGNPGSVGPIGVQGNPGPVGAVGVQGAQGNQGSPGFPGKNNPTQVYGQAAITFSSTEYLPTYKVVPLNNPITFSNQTTTEAILYINVAANATGFSPIYSPTSYYLKIDGGVNGAMFNRIIDIPAIAITTAPDMPVYSLRCSQAIYTKIMPIGVSITITLSISNVTGSGYTFSLGNGFLTAMMVFY